MGVEVTQDDGVVSMREVSWLVGVVALNRCSRFGWRCVDVSDLKLVSSGEMDRRDQSLCVVIIGDRGSFHLVGGAFFDQRHETYTSTKLRVRGSVFADNIVPFK